jgi:hypothetical protein
LPSNFFLSHLSFLKSHPPDKVPPNLVRLLQPECKRQDDQEGQSCSEANHILCCALSLMTASGRVRLSAFGRRPFYRQRPKATRVKRVLIAPVQGFSKNGTFQKKSFFMIIFSESFQTPSIKEGVGKLTFRKCSAKSFCLHSPLLHKETRTDFVTKIRFLFCKVINARGDVYAAISKWVARQLTKLGQKNIETKLGQKILSYFCLRPDSEAVAEGLGRHI